MADTAQPQAIDHADIDRRIVFHPGDRIMEVDFSGFHFDGSKAVNAFYDRLEERIQESGQDAWFFLVNLSGTRIDPVVQYPALRREAVFFPDLLHMY